jgi:hypothetical protein
MATRPNPVSTALPDDPNATDMNIHPTNGPGVGWMVQHGRFSAKAARLSGSFEIGR